MTKSEPLEPAIASRGHKARSLIDGTRKALEVQRLPNLGLPPGAPLIQCLVHPVPHSS